MSVCKYKRGEYCDLRNDIRAKSLKIKSYCIQGPCPDEKPRTNADKIRQMTDEEIEEWYWWMHKEMMYYTDSHTFVHDWLKQEG